MNRPVLFDHLPKCGGSSIASLLADEYPAHCVLRLDGTDIERKRAEFCALSKKDRREIRLIVGHGAGQFRDAVSADFFHVTLLREPVSRVISFIRYVQREKSHYLHDELAKPGATVAAFLANPPTLEIQNFITTLLSGEQAWRVAREPHVASDSAVASLEKNFDLVGAVERIDAFVDQLRDSIRSNTSPLMLPAQILGLPQRAPLPRENSADSEHPDAAHQFSPLERERIRELNQADIMLVQKVDELRTSGAAQKRCRFV